MQFTPLRMQLVQAALQQIPFDTLIKNVQLVNVHSGEIHPAAIGIKHGRVATFLAAENSNAAEIIDGEGMFALPGLIDTHVHIDSTLLTPAGLAELMVPHGTTAVFADPMEISNVAGYAGLEAFFQGKELLPYHVYLEVSSRVPTAPGLETTGGELGLEEVQRLLAWPEAVSLGELDPSKVLGLRAEYFDKLGAAHALGKIANGHAIGLNEQELSAYASGGLSDDHECVTFAEARMRIQMGLAVLIREGSTERNLKELVGGLLREQRDTRHWMMCTDDKHPNEIRDEGHIDYMVNQAIALGMNPVQTIQMATLNAAEHFRIDHEVGSLAPGRWADIILSRSLTPLAAARVFFQGRLVAADGRMVIAPPQIAYPDWLRHSVKITRGFAADDYRLEHAGPQAAARVIGIVPDQIVNRAEQAVLPVVNGSVQTDPGRDLAKLAVVERYGKNGRIGITFVRGFGLQRGAIGITVSHDHHNLVIAGADDESMATCARAAQEMQGGLVAALGREVLAQMPLPLGGLLSDERPQQVIVQLEQMNDAARSLGCTLPAPFMSLSFISLPTVPELGLTDQGLIDVHGHRIISPFID